MQNKMTRQSVIKNRIKLVVSDLDGTLLNRANRISADNLSAIAALRKKGLHFTFATGRLDIMTQIYIEQLGLDAPVISCNGSLIRTGLTRRILHLQYMEAEAAKTIIRYVSDLGLDYLIYDTDEVFYPKESKRIEVYHRYNRLAKLLNSPECKMSHFSIQTDLEAVAGKICKIYLHHPNPEKIELARRFVTEHSDMVAVSSMDNNLDIAPPGQTKGEALKWLRCHYDLEKEESCALGDNDNDASMLAEAGLGFAMKNGSHLAKRAADLIAESHDASGVGRALRQYVL